MQKDILESLVELLSDAEKRYIGKRLVVRGEKNNFSNIFNAIKAGKESPEMTTLQQKNPNSYYVTKNLLKEKIFKLLRTYHSDTSREQAMKNICIDVEILYFKGAYALCLNLIAGALDICQKCEWFELELYLLSCKEKVLLESSGDILQKEMQPCLKEISAALSKLENLHYHRSFMYNVQLVIKKIGMPRNPSEFNKLHKIVYRYKRNDTKKPASHRAQIAHYHAYIYYYYALQDYAQFYHYAQKHLKTIELFQKKSKIPMQGQLSNSLQSLITSELQLKKYDKLNDSLHKIRTLKFDEKKDEANAFSHSYTIETHMYGCIGHFNKILELLPLLEQGLDNYKHLMTNRQKAVMYYNISYLCFGCEQYKLALQWCNKILNDADLNVREDLYCSARILNLAIHYELGNNEILEYLALSTYRYLYKKNRLFQIENAILKFIKLQMKNYLSKKYILNSMQQMLTETKRICSNKREQAALEDFDFICWLESKIQNRPFAEIVKEKAKTK